MFKITVSSSFTASHWHDKSLNEPAHQHHFKYSVSLKGPLNDEGYLADFRQLEALLAQINAGLENRLLNDIFKYPTTENISYYIFTEVKKHFPQTAEVIVHEKENYSASYAG